MQMLEGYTLVLLLLAIGAALLLAELLLPAHGSLGALGLIAALAAIVVTMGQNVWTGLGLTVALALAGPLIGSAMLRIWPRTRLGRRMVLPQPHVEPQAPAVCVGQEGVTVGELRPMGVCEFDNGTRVEATSEHGIVESGRTVKVIALVNNRPVVRRVA
jgi:membrane-bound ClpP family serine protease